MSRVLFVVNELADFNFAPRLERHLAGWDTEVATEMPADCLAYELIVLWSYRKIIKRIPHPNNVVIFHSSDLPDGKGWAPVYYALAENRPQFVVSGILAAPEVDSGDIVLKAKFPILPNYTAKVLREFDHEISIIAARKILERFRGRAIVGAPQVGEGSFYKRRRPEDNRIDLTSRLGDVVSHLRACEETAPAYFEYRGCRYRISIEPETAPEFPDEIEFIFAEEG